MPDSALTPNVFLDTEVFEAHNLDLSSPNLRRLVRLTRAGKVNLLLTSVTRREVLAHLDEKAKEAFRHIKEFRRAARTMRKILPGAAVDALEAADKDAACKTLRTEFDSFIVETKATVVPVDKVCPEEIFEKYFAGAAPFGEGNKKSEFPDAFACGALQAWRATNESGKIYIVSNDNDWKRACKDDPNLLSVTRIDELLQLFADSVLVTAILEALESMREDLVERVKQKAMDLDYFPGDQLIEGEVDDVEEVDAEIEDFHVVEVKDGLAAVSVDCKLTVSALISAQDADSGIYDHEAEDMHYVWTASGSVTRTLERVVEVSLSYEVDHPERCTITGLDFEDNSVDLDVSEHELSRDDDNEYDDIEPPDYGPDDTGPPDYEPPDYEPPDYEPPD